MSRIIAVVSAKGGVGKSSVCAGLGRALAGMGYSVLLVDADIALRSLDILLNAGEEAVFDWGDILNKNCEVWKAVLSLGGNLSLLRAPASGEGVETDGFVRMIKSVSGGFDFVILDSPAGLEKGFTLCVSAAREVIVVSTPDDVSIHAASLAADRARASGAAKLRLIINRYVKKQNARHIDEVIDGTCVRLVGIVPEDRELLLSSNGGQISFYSPASAAFRRIARRMLGENIPLNLKGM